MHFGLTPGVKLVRLAKTYGVEELTFYGFTVDNCMPPQRMTMSILGIVREAQPFFISHSQP